MSSSLILTTICVLLAAFIGCTLSDGSFFGQSSQNTVDVCPGADANFNWKYNETNGETMQSITWIVYYANNSSDLLASSNSGRFLTSNPRITHTTNAGFKIANVTKADEGMYTVSGLARQLDHGQHFFSEYSADNVTLHVKDIARLKNGQLALHYETENKTERLKCGPFSSFGDNDTSVTWTTPNGTASQSTDHDKEYFIYLLTDPKEGLYSCIVNYGSCSQLNDNASLSLDLNKVRFESIESRLESLEEQVRKLTQGNGTTDSPPSQHDLQELQGTLLTGEAKNIFMSTQEPRGRSP